MLPSTVSLTDYEIGDIAGGAGANLSKAGDYLDCASSGDADCVFYSNAQSVHSGEITIFAIINVDDDISDKGICAADNFSSGRRDFQFRVTGGGFIQFITFYGNSADTSIVGATDLGPLGKVNVAARAQDGLQEVFVNGVQEDSNTRAGNMDADDPAFTLCGVSRSATVPDPPSNDEFRGRLYCVYTWNRALSDVELRELNADPYQFLREVTPRVYFTTDAPPVARRRFVITG